MSDLDQIRARIAMGRSTDDDAVQLILMLDEARDSLAEASKIWDGPETDDFLEGLRKEAAHQVARWGRAHDDGKGPEAFYWTLSYLAGKALRAAIDGDIEKAKHHTISSAALLRNWHGRLSGSEAAFRPGIEGQAASVPGSAVPQTTAAGADGEQRTPTPGGTPGMGAGESDSKAAGAPAPGGPVLGVLGDPIYGLPKARMMTAEEARPIFERANRERRLVGLPEIDFESPPVPQIWVLDANDR